MQINQLKYAVQVGQLLNFSKAADRLCVTQPALSHQIQKLEDEFGVLLFERRTRSVKLTPAGAVFVAAAARILADLDALQRTMNDIRLTHIGQIRVGSTSTQIVPGLFDHVAAFQADRPGVSVRIVETAGSRSLIEMLGNGDVDAAFVVASDDDLQDSRIRFHPLVTGHVALLVGTGHPLATRAAVRLTEVADAAFVFPGRSLSIHTLALKLCRESGFEPRIVCECDQVDTMIGFVAAGRGVGFVSSQSIAERPLSGVVAVPLDPAVTRLSCLAVAADKLHEPTVAQFRDFLLGTLAPV